VLQKSKTVKALLFSMVEGGVCLGCMSVLVLHIGARLTVYPWMQGRVLLGRVLEMRSRPAEAE